MSYELRVDDREAMPLASNVGMGDVQRWLVHVRDADEVQHFFEHGWTDEPETMAQQLEAAMEATPPPRTVRATLDHLLACLHGEMTVARIGNGAGEQEGP